MYMHLQEFHYFVLGQTLKRFAIMQNNATLLSISF